MTPHRPPPPPGRPSPMRPRPIKPPFSGAPLSPLAGKGPPVPISAAVSGILAGPSANLAQRAINHQVARKSDWPYEYIFPPPQSKRVEPEGIIAAPSVGVQTQVLQYQVPDGCQFAFTALIAVYTGSGFTLGSTDITWTLDINTPLPTVSGAPLQGYPVQSMSPSNIPKGGIAFSASGPQSVYDPWPLPMVEFLGPKDILRSKVTTGATITPGAPNYFITIFCGWIWQTTL